MNSITLTPSSSTKNDSDLKVSKETQLVPNRYQVRSGTMPFGTPSFTNLLNQVTSIKLDKCNFLLWQNIVLPILRSYKLEGHLIEKTPPPEQSIIIPPYEGETNGLLPNLEYDIWLVADQILVG